MPGEVNPYQSPTTHDLHGGSSPEAVRQGVRTLRFVLAVDVVLLPIGVVLHIVSEPWLPIELRQFIEAHLTNLDSAYDITVLCFSLGLLILLPTAWLGLFFTRPFSRPLYLITMFASLALVAAAGPEVLHGAAAACNTLSSIVSGVLLGLAYFSPAKWAFERPPETT